ncbi:hypothetical protein KFL_003600100 [Klebsormidium nitens]|uniref:Pre-SET domain-containing protein n=1 Tax=Klebsormidium nitens TaxID=105231 RepID=A0A1Y1IEN7_KLENI|nr:hypothetical protein KFL_003600100 [Klebsormidium nitens]|eukprot:GAQ87551.1 hypothetical protein KFL_003600100 [Klebsormidium nitens]
MTQRGESGVSREQLKEVDDVAQVLSEVFDVTPEYVRGAFTCVWQNYGFQQEAWAAIKEDDWADITTYIVDDLRAANPNDDVSISAVPGAAVDHPQEDSYWFLPRSEQGDGGSAASDPRAKTSNIPSQLSDGEAHSEDYAQCLSGIPAVSKARDPPPGLDENGKNPVAQSGPQHREGLTLAALAIQPVRGNREERVVSPDISRGRERVPISCVNAYTEDNLPKGFRYMTGSVPFDRARKYAPGCLSRLVDQDQCRCKGDCVGRKFECWCTNITRGSYAYNREGQLSQQFLRQELDRMKDIGN